MTQIARTWRSARLRRTYDTSPAHLLVVAPTERELGGLHPNRLSGFGVATIGIGPSAAANLRNVIRARPPQIILSIGFAGALNDDLRTGDLVINQKALYVHLVNHSVSLPGGLVTQATQALNGPNAQVTLGNIVTVPRPLLTAGAKAQMGLTSGATIVDMESFWVAQEAERSGVPLVSVRTVLDELSHELPDFVTDISADGGRRELYHSIRAMRNPINVGTMIPLALRSRKAIASIREVVASLVPALTKNAPVRAVYR